MTGQVAFQIHRSKIVVLKCYGFALLAMGLLFLSLALFDPEFPWWLALLSGVPALAGGFCLVRLGRRRRIYSVELSVDGVRLPADNRWAPWSQLADLSDDPEHQRVNIVDYTGSHFASLEYQLDGFQEALERTMAQIRLSPPERDTFQRQISSGSRLFAMGACALMGSVGTWLWLSSGWLSGLLVATVLVIAAACNEAIEIRFVELKSEGLAIQRGFRTRIVPWNEIAGAELSLEPASSGRQTLQVVILYRSGRRQRIRPFGCNPFHLQARLAKKLTAEGGAA